MTQDAIEVPPVEMMGPAMRALNPRQQRFVCALAIYGGDQSEAYLAAGYDVKTRGAVTACSSRLAANEMVIEAIREEALRRINSSTLLAVSTLVELASQKNADQKLRKAAADSLLDRVQGFAGKSEHNIVITDERTTKELIDFIRSTAAANGLDAKQLLGLPKEPSGIVDAEFSEVDPDLADLL